MSKKTIEHGPTKHVEIVGPLRNLVTAQAIADAQAAINARLKAVPEYACPDGGTAYPVDVRFASVSDTSAVVVLTYRELKV